MRTAPSQGKAQYLVPVESTLPVHTMLTWRGSDSWHLAARSSRAAITECPALRTRERWDLDGQESRTRKTKTDTQELLNDKSKTKQGKAKQSKAKERKGKENSDLFAE